jgi:superfamily II DNA or RNA helicase
MEAYSVALRPYQDDLYAAVRYLIAIYDAVMCQLSTGGGKTWIFSVMVANALSKNNPVWIVVPRNELLQQASEQIRSLNIAHGVINAKNSESRAFKVHVVSKDTLLRRIKAGKIKNWPKLIIFDEAHLALDQQLFVKESAPKGTKFIGFTATPERLCGRGLDEMYDEIAYGPTYKDMVEMGYLSNVRYFSIPGISAADFKSKDYSGTEIKNDVLENILAKRHIYGNVINEYREKAHNKSCIVFCRSVKAAETTAQRFRDAGYKFEPIDGKMTSKQRKALINGLDTGQLHGLTSCELICYGLNVPRVECIIKLRFTMSKALNSQMDGRGSRPYPGKDYCVILDPVGCLMEHGHPLEDYEWKFHGTERRKKKKGISVASLKICQKCFLYFNGDKCPHCGTIKGTKPDKNYEEIDGRLVEMKGPIKLQDRPAEERREYQDKYGELIDKIKSASPDDQMDRYVKEILNMSEAAGYGNAMAVYWKVSADMLVVNVPLLHSIRRVKGYKPGWIWMQKQSIENRLGRV